jgi:UPF0755 protein
MEGYIEYRNKKRNIIVAAIILFVVLATSIFLYLKYFSAPFSGATLDRFVLPASISIHDLSNELQSRGYVKNSAVLNYLIKKKYDEKTFNPGTYKISKSMNVFQIADIFAARPSEIQVVIPPGLRKEEIREILSDKFDWSVVQVKEWNEATSKNDDYFEGVYFPDTYLIPSDSTPADIAKRLRVHFEERFSIYSPVIAKQNIKWTTILKVASLIQREAGSSSDMPIISGIIWNRLDKKMKLQIDATVQYAKGSSGRGWWTPATHADLSIDSPYNTYLNTGLPPHPISNPGIYAIDAAVNPTKTTCLYYIHDSSRNIHCATTNSEQNANVSKYLK